MNAWLWVTEVCAAVAVEGYTLGRKHRPTGPLTIDRHHVSWLLRTTGIGHVIARYVLALLALWLIFNLLV